jgi:hypothetical protein
MASGGGVIGRRRSLSSCRSISVLRSQLIDDPSAAPLGPPSLGNMLPLATQRSMVALIAWEFSVTSYAYIREDRGQRAVVGSRARC